MRKNLAADARRFTRIKLFLSVCICVHLWLNGFVLNAANPELLSHEWSAHWISVPATSPFDYGVYHFRRTFNLSAAPSAFLIHVTADNRYKLYVNGVLVSLGPARGDLHHWRYESVDIGHHLKAGKNALAAVVWNFGDLAPEAQITNQTGLLVQGDREAERIVDTGTPWKCARDTAYSPAPPDAAMSHFYYAAGPGEKIDAKLYPWGWEQPDFDDSSWKTAQVDSRGSPRDAQDGPNSWMLVPRSIPPMELTPQPITVLRSGGPSREIPPYAHVTLLYDQTYLTTGYPQLTLSGGTGAKITIGYAESLFLPGFRDKGNRNQIEGKQFIGTHDLFIADGGLHRRFEPLWWRTWRYLQLTIETQDHPLTIDDLQGVYTGYPFERKARLDAGSSEIQKILDTGWRTARLCAHETYMDCPYYEQLQYAGDTRIQALVSLYTTGDGRLMRNAIELLDSSRSAEGATYSRAPSRLQQYIPPFSLWWIGMLHDYWMYQDDPAFVARMLPGVRAVLWFFAAHQQAGASLGRMPWWNFVDWTKEWTDGTPPALATGNSAPLDLQLLLAYQWAAEMEAALGNKSLAEEDRQSAATLRDTVRRLYWDAGRQLFADTPAKREYSQQANALAVLAGVSEGDAAHDLIERVASDQSLVQCSIYFRHYLHSAMNKAGAGDRYLDMLGPWRTMLGLGLTTWAETADPTRSDCHAWGASPNFELFRTVLGIDSAAPGFARVLIRPFLGKLTHVSGAIPHPKGEIAVTLSLNHGKLDAGVTLPAGVTGRFEWHGQTRDLHPGENRFTL
ncbi:MAG: alpha-L-rhamnosidase N-terminal domain-containing protein [Bryobacteraceae bacterium]